MPRSAEDAPRHTRRPHQKSRQGCADCRRRRIKCDEARPKCRQCVRREVPCVYPAASSATAASSPNTEDGRASQTSAAADSISVAQLRSNGNAPAQFTTQDLALLHRWTCDTSRAVVNNHPDLLHFWQVVFPQVGFQHPFVLHGIFSLAALHQAHLHADRRQQLAAEAASHHNNLIDGFRSAVAEDMEATCDALFVTTSLNIVYIFGMYGWIHDGEDGDAERRSRILGLDWIPMVRGVDAVLHPIHQTIRQGPLGPLLDMEPFESIDLDCLTSAEDGDLRGMSSLWSDDKNNEAYDSALFVLRECYAYMTKFESASGNSSDSGYYSQSVSGPLIWILLAPNDYFTLLAQRQPPALVMFAYVGALFHRLDHYWYFRGWGRSIVEAVDELLGEYWRPWLTAPKESTFVGHSNRRST